MTVTAAERRRAYDGPAVFSLGFRPFFLAAAAFAGVAVPVWMALFAQGAQPFGDLPAVAWHAHEMLFGFMAAVVTGFLLTAVPNWTGRLPVFGGPLIAMFALWLAGRIAMAAYATLGPIAAAVDSAFLLCVAALLWREILAGGNARNVPVCIVVSLLALANVAFHVSVAGGQIAQAPERLGLSALAFLIALIGGRITPSFTRTWLKAQGARKLPAPTDRFDLAVLAVAGAAFLAWSFGAPPVASGGLLLAAALGLAGRLARWCGASTWREPLVFILHVGYAWLAVGVAFLGLSELAPLQIQRNAALHAIAAGAVGVMVLAVMTRASRGHTGRALAADPLTVMIFVLVNLGAALRVAVYVAPDAHDAFLWSGGAVWSAAFALFALGYGPMLCSPRADQPR